MSLVLLVVNKRFFFYRSDLRRIKGCFVGRFFCKDIDIVRFIGGDRWGEVVLLLVVRV